MADNFEVSLERVLKHEGGWSDHPRDPGGATMKGVTLATYRRHFGARKSKRALRNITDEELAHIYRSGYWDKCKCDQLPDGVDYAVFDAAVNSGPGRSAKWLQAAVGAGQDGDIGSKTLARVSAQDPAETIETLCDRRLGFLQGLSTWETFGRGWGRRVEGVRSTALAMTAAGPAEVVPDVDYVVTRRGSRGKWVRKLQQALGIVVDGRFGRGTETTLIEWQREQGLEADGIAGRLTYRALGLIA